MKGKLTAGRDVVWDRTDRLIGDETGGRQAPLSRVRWTGGQGCAILSNRGREKGEGSSGIAVDGERINEIEGDRGGRGPIATQGWHSHACSASPSLGTTPGEGEDRFPT